ncbi:hypothetical protein Tco_1111467 [Tanacetum coccineum]|uniref:Tf2-1-like SH3-like domain-containing protein n=1 Tax=Tanacetum coccineum TaxID=301880 RepID=A0ABQ5IM00_9ASTR
MLRDLDKLMEKRQMMVSTLWIKIFSGISMKFATIRKETSENLVMFLAMVLTHFCMESKRNDNGSPKFIGWSVMGWGPLHQLSREDFKILRWMIYLMVLADAKESIRDMMDLSTGLASSSGVVKGVSMEGRSAFYERRVSLALRYVGPFKILERIGSSAYRLDCLKELSGVHDTFHVSNLKKCLADASLHVLLDEIKVDKTLHFVEEPIEIMDREVKSLKRCRILLVKVY